MNPVPPPLPNVKDTWFQRNRRWFIPCVAVGGVAAIAGLMFLGVSVGLGFMRKSEAYTGALTKVTEAPAVVEALGSPVKDGFIFSGTIKVSTSGEWANLRIPISGPKGAGKALVSATKIDGIWHYYRLVVEVGANQKSIDLSEPLDAKTLK